jgi:hypothetical protein
MWCLAMILLGMACGEGRILRGVSFLGRHWEFWGVDESGRGLASLWWDLICT